MTIKSTTHPLYSVPLAYAVDAAVRYYSAIADLSWPMWLDSSGHGRYDILCAQPVTLLVTQGLHTEVRDTTGSQWMTDDPFDLLRRYLAPSINETPDIPFLGGAVGYWGYDLARRLLVIPTQAQDNEKLPEMAVGIYDWAIVIDHQKKRAKLVSQQRSPDTAQVLPKILQRLQHATPVRAHNAFQVQGLIRSNFTRAEYQSAFDQVQGYLSAGDCYQVNLAQRYAASASGEALQAYLVLRQMTEAPYSAFMNLPGLQILCASPENFLQVLRGQVITRPIKGTRPRRQDAEQDRQMANELLHSAKDRAENLMIVDLLRNDLGKSCIPGSVKTPRLFELESFAQVHHLVSTITAQLAPGHDALSLLRSCFPGGSVTGAPKQRAMEIIEQLEPHRRGIYCGAMGYIGYDGNMDTNIAIRTLVYAKNEIRFWVGGGIVADSDASAEYQETLDKAKAMLQLLRQFGGSA